jgi:hypothetical protein
MASSSSRGSLSQFQIRLLDAFFARERGFYYPGACHPKNCAPSSSISCSDSAAPPFRPGDRPLGDVPLCESAARHDERQDRTA